MTKRAAVLLLLAAALAASGCCGGWVYRPFGPGTLCNTSNCGCYEPCGPLFGGPCCGPTCGPICGPTCAGACGPACGPCEDPCGPTCDPCCDPCGPTCDPCCHPCCHPCGWPFGWVRPVLFSLFHPLQWGGCNGCGELYLGDFHGDPPDCCDPCDDCGSWTGGAPGMDFPAGPPMAAPVGPPVQVVPSGGCPHCGQVHASPARTPNYAMNRAPRMMSPTGRVMRTAATQTRSAMPKTSQNAVTQTGAVVR